MLSEQLTPKQADGWLVTWRRHTSFTVVDYIHFCPSPDEAREFVKDLINSYVVDTAATLSDVTISRRVKIIATPSYSLKLGEFLT